MYINRMMIFYTHICMCVYVCACVSLYNFIDVCCLGIFSIKKNDRLTSSPTNFLFAL